MDIKNTKRMFVHTLYVVVMLVVLLSVSTVAYAAPPSPFVGHWQAIDVDGGDIRLSIGGKLRGPFQITWTESYFGLCGGEAGIARGTGWLNEGDPYVLEADIHLTCFTTGARVDFHPVWHYDPSTGWMTSQDEGYGAFVTTWHRPGESLPLLWNLMIAHPDENWVEGMGFPEGTVVSLLIRDPDGVNLFMGTTVASYPDWDLYNTAARFFLDFDLKAGDHLWMSDGMVARDLIVTNLQITETNLADKTVSGIATPGSEVIIEYFPERSDPVMFSVFADQDGFWMAIVDDLAIGLPGPASEPDADGDLTRVTFIVPKMDLRVNYSHDWVESFYEAGHQVLVTVTDPDGNTKATAGVVTEQKEYWGGEPGFQTLDSIWLDGDGNPMDSPPDIQPGDWVYTQVDNGVIAQVQIGNISGTIDLDTDSIEGTIMAPWIAEPVQVECLDWGSGQEPPFDNKDGGLKLTNGEDPYFCSWEEWDIQPGQNVGVGYFGPDGHWVANAFFIPMSTFVAYMPVTIVGYDWPIGDTIDISINDGEYTAQEAVGNAEWDPTVVLFELWQDDFTMEAGDHIVMTDETAGISKEVWVTNLAVTDIDESASSVSGLYNPDYDLWVWLYGQEWQIPVTNPENGTWVATFDQLQPGAWGGAVQHDGDGDGTSIDFQVPQLVLYIHYEYPDVVEGSYELGHNVQVTVFDSGGATKATASVSTMEMPHWGGAPGFRVEQWDGSEGPPDIQPGDVVRAVLDGGLVTTEVRIGEIAGTIDLDANNITSTINAPWAGDIVNVLCMPWGASGGASEKETTVTPDGISEFTCTWDSTEWDIQPGETVGVAYWGNDLHWVANAIPNPWIVAFPEANQVFGYGWPIGSEVNLTINGTDIATATVEGAPWDANDIMAFFDFNGVHDLAPEDVVMLSGSGMVRTHTIQNLAVTEVNVEPDTVSGTADTGAVVHAWVHGFGHDVWLTVTDGAWSAYFGSDGFHLEPGMCGRAEIRVDGNNSTNVDWCVP